MKTYIFGLVFLLLSFSAFSAEVDCVNESSYNEEDSLVLNLETMTGQYFDNNTWIDLVCQQLELEEKAFIFCHEKGNKNRLTTQVKPDGKATVVYSHCRK